MKYYRPTSLQKALEYHEAGAVYLSGGTQVNQAPLDRGRPQAVVDLRDIVPWGVENNVIGALTTLQDLVDSHAVPQALRMAAGFIPTRSIRNIATIGGNIAARRPDSYLIPTLMALKAILRTAEGGEVSVEDYIDSSRRDLIMEILLLESERPCVAVKESRSHLSLPVVSAAVSIKDDDCVIAAGCVGPRTLRLRSVEEAVMAGSRREELEASIRGAINPRADILGSAEYKTYINGTVIADAVMRCREVLS